MEKFAAFGAECGSGVFTPNCGRPPGPKNIFGIKRKQNLERCQGKSQLRSSNPPNGM